MAAADVLLVAIPHFALTPSKLIILLEKLQEIVFLEGCQNPTYRSPLYQKPVGLIVHGGPTAKAISYNKIALLAPLANIFTSVQMKVVGGADDYPGAVFGIRSLSIHPNSIFVGIEHDWEDIHLRLQSLVNNLSAVLH